MYELIKFLGWVTVVLSGIAAIMYFLRRLNKYLLIKKFENEKIKFIQKILKRILPYLARIHPIIGITAIITGIIHGYLLLRTFQIHTGYIAWYSLLLLGISGIIGKYVKAKFIKTHWKKVHQILMFLMIILVAIHIIYK